MELDTYPMVLSDTNTLDRRSWKLIGFHSEPIA